MNYDGDPKDRKVILEVMDLDIAINGPCDVL